MDRRQEVAGGLVVSGSDGTKLLQFAEEVLGQPLVGSWPSGWHRTPSKLDLLMIQIDDLKYRQERWRKCGHGASLDRRGLMEAARGFRRLRASCPFNRVYLLSHSRKRRNKLLSRAGLGQWIELALGTSRAGGALYTSGLEAAAAAGTVAINIAPARTSHLIGCSRS